MNLENIKKNMQDIKDDVKKYSENPENVKIVVATKYVDASGVKKVIEAGVKAIGENRAQVFRDKIAELGIENVEWHFIGHLQKNKIKYIIDNVELIHSVDSLGLAREIDKKAEKINKKVNILLEVNISREESKSGYKIEELKKEIEEYKKLLNINIKGLMTMAPFSAKKDEIRAVFKGLRLFKEELNKNYFEGTLSELSMGMSNDYDLALLEGATIIRIGSKVFS